MSHYLAPTEITRDSSLPEGHSVMGQLQAGGQHILATNTVGIVDLQPSPDNQEYVLAQFHWHWRASSSDLGSEHSIDGKFYPAEMHFVTFKREYQDLGSALASGEPAALLVVAVFFELSNTDHPEMEQMIRVL